MSAAVNGHRPTARNVDPMPPGLLDQLCEAAERLAAGMPGPVGRVSLRLGEASLEVEFAAPAGPEVSLIAGPPVPVAGPAPEGTPVPAPLVGTFYLAPGPGQPAFVAVGDTVETGQTLGIVEAMKLMNPILAPAPGVVLAVLAGDGEPVEYDQTLVLLGPCPEEV